MLKLIMPSLSLGMQAAGITVPGVTQSRMVYDYGNHSLKDEWVNKPSKLTFADRQIKHTGRALHRQASSCCLSVVGAVRCKRPGHGC